MNTGGDFQMLAMTQALAAMNTTRPLELHVIFHFAVFDGQPTRRAMAYGDQVRDCLDACALHQVHLHATTPALANQMRAVGIDASPIPYPTRSRIAPSPATQKNGARPLKIVLAGIPRAEKGKRSIRQFLTGIEAHQLKTGRFRCSLQMPKKRWKRLVPESLHPEYLASIKDPGFGRTT